MAVTYLDKDNVPTKRQRELPASVVDAITSAPRGCYQENLVAGHQNWSGADLVGTASKYGAHYHRSRASLLVRIGRAMPTSWTIATRLVLIDSRWRRELVLETPRGASLLY